MDEIKNNGNENNENVNINNNGESNKPSGGADNKNSPPKKNKKPAPSKTRNAGGVKKNPKKKPGKKPLMGSKHKKPVLRVVEGTGGKPKPAVNEAEKSDAARAKKPKKTAAKKAPEKTPESQKAPEKTAAKKADEKGAGSKPRPSGKPRPPKKAPGIKKLKAAVRGRKGIFSFLRVNKISITAILAIIFLLALAILLNSHIVLEIGEKQTMFSKEYSMSSKADFSVLGDNIFYVSKDGMIFLDKDGNTLWTDTFTMSSPYMLCDGDYAAVADSGSKTVNVYDKSGKLYQISAAGPITTFAVNPLGCCAVVCKVNEDYRVDVYSNTGETMFECARASKDGIPLGIDISNDGSVVAIALVNYYNNININSSVLFYYTVKSEAQTTESSDGLISAVEVPDALAGIVKFMPDNYCIVASDKSLMYIDCSGSAKKDEEQPRFDKEWEKVFKNYITAFDIVNNKEIAIAFGDAVSVVDEQAAADENTVHWYNLRGREIGSAKSEERITDISSSDKGTIITSGKDFTAYNSRGRELWSYTAIQNVSGMKFYNSEDRAVLITPTSMRILDVRKGAKMQEEQTEATADEAEDKADDEPEEETAAEEETQETQADARE